MKPLVRILWLAVFLMGYAVLVGLQFMWAPADGDVIAFVRVWLPLSGVLIFCLVWFLPREPAAWAAPLLCYLVPAAWFREGAFVDPMLVIILLAASGVSAFVFRRFLTS